LTLLFGQHRITGECANSQFATDGVNKYVVLPVISPDGVIMTTWDPEGHLPRWEVALQREIPFTLTPR
jgi:hypothetical protein